MRKITIKAKRTKQNKTIKKVSRKTQRRNLDDMLRSLCFKRDGYKCLYCGKTTHLQMSHIFPRGEYPWMTYILDNVKTLCMRHHLFWWHKNPISAYLWLIKTLGSDRVEKLKKLTLINNKETYEQTMERLKNTKI